VPGTEDRGTPTTRHATGVEIVSYEAPGWGVGEIWLEAGVLVSHELPQARAAATPAASAAHPLAERLMAYFRGDRVAFEDVEIDLEWATPFQLAVAGALRAVPYGEVVTYGELAALAGHPNAQRAAGSFCAGNCLPILLPCHRVVSADGLGSYGSLGQAYKRRLLALEGVAA
jgi:methylated-DNA-[protein]-cysteine S-methyltransferase